MNPKFQAWFSQNKVSDALCGFDEFLVEDPTYRGEHDFVLAVDELLQWAKGGHESSASLGFEEAVRTLIRRKTLGSLLRTYALLTPDAGIELSFNKTAVLEMIAAAVGEAGGRGVAERSASNIGSPGVGSISIAEAPDRLKWRFRSMIQQPLKEPQR